MIALFREDIESIIQSLPPQSRKRPGCDYLMSILTAKELEFDREMGRVVDQNLANDPEYQAQISGVQ